MKGRRWDEAEDQLLKEAVLASIENGGTQLDAFAEVGEKLDRTPGACGFRWNAVLRQDDPHSYQEAKRKRVDAQLAKRKELRIDSFQHIIQMMEKLDQEWKQAKQDVALLTQVVSQKRITNEALQRENAELREQRSSLQLYRKEVQSRYQDLLQLFTTLRQQLKKTQNGEVFGASVDTEADSPT